jgi:hypothetical protein
MQTETIQLQHLHLTQLIVLEVIHQLHMLHPKHLNLMVKVQVHHPSLVSKQDVIRNIPESSTVITFLIMENVCLKKGLEVLVGLSIRLLLCARVEWHAKEASVCINTQTLEV